MNATALLTASSTALITRIDIAIRIIWGASEHRNLMAHGGKSLTDIGDSKRLRPIMLANSQNAQWVLALKRRASRHLIGINRTNKCRGNLILCIVFGLVYFIDGNNFVFAGLGINLLRTTGTNICRYTPKRMASAARTTKISSFQMSGTWVMMNANTHSKAVMA